MSGNTRPVPNIQSPIVDTKTGKLLAPWIQFFQQFVQKAAAVVDVSTSSPYQANQNGTLILTGAGAITLTRGQVNIDLTGQRIIPISVGDTVIWSGGIAQFLGA